MARRDTTNRDIAILAAGYIIIGFGVYSFYFGNPPHPYPSHKGRGNVLCFPTMERSFLVPLPRWEGLEEE